MQAAASYLGLSQDKLLSQLKSGKSLADVTKAQSKSLPGLEKAILAAGTSQINASTTLTATQKAELISDLKSHLGAIVTATNPPGPGTPGAGWAGRGGGWATGGSHSA